MLRPLSPHPAALFRDGKKQGMVVSDLHLGWETALSEKGIFVPAQMPKLLRKLQSLISEFGPSELLILGDVKYSVAAAYMGEWHDVPDFFDGLKDRVNRICIVRGNHDGGIEPLLPSNVRVLPSSGVVVGHVGFFHGHRWPALSLLGCRTLVMGHVHPVVVFRDIAGFRTTRQVWIKAVVDGRGLARVLLGKHGVKVEGSVEQTLWRHGRVKPLTAELFIMPSFNEFLGGRPLNERRVVGGRSHGIMGPVLRSDVVDLGGGEAYLLDGTLLGTLDQLRGLS
jgi:putative SbcD/Mre11-related phosphoesterase